MDEPGDRLLLRKALEHAWSDFADDVRNAIPPGATSMAMEWRIDWIGELSKQVGPIDWKAVEIPLLESGWLQRVHGILGFTVPVAEIAQWLEQYKRGGGP